MYCYQTLLFLLVMGCADSGIALTDDDAPDSTQPVAVYVHFGVEIAGTDTRATAGDGTGEEKISTVTLFLVAQHADGSEDWTDVQYQTVDYPVSADGKHLSRIETKPGNKQVYIGANLTVGQIAAIRSSANGTGLHASAGQGYEAVIGEFVHPGGIVMTGKGTNALTVPATPVTPDNPLDAGSIELERVVSKVLLVCDTYTGGTYAKMSTDAARPMSDPGWIKLSDIRFALNTTNRKVYLLKTADGKDPNDDIAPYVTTDAGGNYVSTEAGASNFDFCALQDIHATGIAPLAYNAGTYGTASGSTGYTEGMYCLENTTSTTFTALSSDWTTATANVVARLVTTHLLVAAKFIPATIIDGNGATQTPASPDNATALLPATTAADGEAHEAGTYFTRDGSTYYNYAGMKKAITDNPAWQRGDFRTFEGGTGYFYTYAGGETNADGTLKFSAASGISRNNYCVVRITRFNQPSTVLLEPIRATMTTMEWKTGEIEAVIRPS